MLSADAIQRLEQLQLRTPHRLAGQIAGEHRSRRYGDTIEFADYRDYHPGDDFRRVDTKVLARLDVLRVRLFEADEDLTVRILLDTSGSMGLHGKLDAAVSIAVGIGAVALTSGDPVVVSALPDAAPPRRFAGRDALAGLVHHLGGLEASGRTPFVDAARRSLAASGPAGLHVVISDLLTPEWRRATSRLKARRGDVLVVHVLAPEETDPELLGDLALIDEETAERVAVSLSDDRLATYRQRVTAWREAVRRHCHAVGGRYLAVDASDDIEVVLTRAWRTAGVLR